MVKYRAFVFLGPGDLWELIEGMYPGWASLSRYILVLGLENQISETKNKLSLVNQNNFNFGTKNNLDLETYNQRSLDLETQIKLGLITRIKVFHFNTVEIL